MSNTKAKTASKTAPTNRNPKLEYEIDGKIVCPTRYFDKNGRKSMAVKFKASGELVKDAAGFPVEWHKCVAKKKKI
jgi:hypothetical protein